jgi:4-hydroxythreonine-4-phosphate dehydrogenase
VTNPINKAGLYANGFEFPGHTEFLGALTGVTRPVMMLAVEGLKVVPATIHQSIASVPSSLSINLLVETGLIVAEALRRDFGISAPRLVMTGLNPHAGESGSIGHEDHDIIEPAVEALRAAGVDIRGPLSADSLFHAKARQGYDAAICQYHDQALIPIKTIDFFGGVNVTLGLPIVRTSPDHGTGYDIAGQHVADPSSLLAAIRMAASIATHRAQLRAIEPRS